MKADIGGQLIPTNNLEAERHGLWRLRVELRHESIFKFDTHQAQYLNELPWHDALSAMTTIQ